MGGLRHDDDSDEEEGVDEDEDDDDENIDQDDDDEESDHNFWESCLEWQLFTELNTDNQAL